MDSIDMGADRLTQIQACLEAAYCVLEDVLAELARCDTEITRLRAALQQAGRMKSIAGARRIVEETLTPEVARQASD